MVAFRKDILKAGSFHTHAGRVSFGISDLLAMRDNFRAMKKAGLHVPLLYEHAEPGSSDGAPQLSINARDKNAAKVKHGAGWIRDMDVTSDGRLVAELDATDKTAAEKLKNGSIRFVSPEIRREYTDGAGNTYRNAVSHVALTHSPRNTDQKPFVALSCLQLSIEDMADEDEDKTPAEDESRDADETPNPDLPKEASDEDQELEALLAQLEAFGLPLAANTNQDTLVHDLLIALKVASDAKSKAEAESEEKSDEDSDDKVVEQAPGISMSLNTPEMKKFRDGLRRTTESRIDALFRLQRITPAMRKQLKATASGIQLSNDGGIQRTLSIADLLDVIESGTVDGIALSNESTSGVAEITAEEHHNPSWLSRADKNGNIDIQGKEADELVKGFLQRTGGKR